MTAPTGQPDTGLGPSRARPAREALRLLGSTRMFSLAVEQLIELPIQQEIAGDRLSRSQWKLLEIFALTDVRNVTDIASYQGVSTAAASKAADRLVRLGLVTRNEDLDDRRHIRLALSSEGRRLVQRYLSAIEDRIENVFSTATQDGASHLAHKLDEMVATTKASEEDLRRICLQCALNRREPCLLQERRDANCNFNAHHRNSARHHEASGLDNSMVMARLRPVNV
jgi:DNA-binding MarR family transcriptional regulator